MKVNIRNIFKKYGLLVSLILTGLFLRAVLNNVVYSNDAEAFVFWGYYLRDHSVSSLLENLPGGYTPYPPFYYYVTRLIAILDTFINANNSTWFTYMLFKIPTITFEVITTFLIFRIVLNKLGKNSALLSASFYFLNPAAIYNTAIFGQTDLLISGLVFISLIALSGKKYLVGIITYVLAFLIKLQALALFPLIVILTIRQKNKARLIGYFLFALGMCLLPFLEVIYDKGIVWTVTYFKQLPHWYPYTSIYAYNLWSFTGFIVPDSIKIFNLFPYKYLSQIIFWIVAIAILYPLSRKKFDLYSLVFAGFLLFFNFAFFETRVHSRYLLYSLPFASLLLFYYPKQIIILNIIMFANLALPLKFNFLKEVTYILNSKKVIILFIFLNLALFINMYLNYINDLKGLKSLTSRQ